MSAAPTARLREAATVVREAAAGVAEAVASFPFGAEYGYSEVMDSWLGHGSGALAALMHPGVGEALAAWLESVAELHEPSRTGCCGRVLAGCQWCADEDWPCADMRHALAVAGAVLAAVTR